MDQEAYGVVLSDTLKGLKLLKLMETQSKKWQTVYSLLRSQPHLVVDGVRMELLETEPSLLFEAMDVVLLKIGEDHSRAYAHELNVFFDLMD